MSYYLVFRNTSLQAGYADLPASPAWLIGRFAPLHLAFCALCSQKFSKKKGVSQSTQNALKRIEM